MFAFPHVRRGLSRTTAGAVFVGLAACAPIHTPPQQVETAPPKVSYTYHSDADLVEANRKAQSYCNQYQSMPSLDGNITTNPDGTKTVTYRCLQTAAAVPPPPSPQPMHYTYRSDTELINALGAADAYCRRNGQTVSSNITTNADGSKSLSFRCVPS